MSNPTLYKLLPVIKEVVMGGGKAKIKPRGISMLPFIRQDVDEVFLRQIDRNLKSGKIYLYQRLDGSVVLHRLLKIKNGELTFRGDNQIRKEHGIRPEMLIAEVESVQRGSKTMKPGDLTYFVFQKCAFWCCLFNRLVCKGRSFGRKMCYKVFKKH